MAARWAFQEPDVGCQVGPEHAILDVGCLAAHARRGTWGKSLGNQIVVCGRLERRVGDTVFPRVGDTVFPEKGKTIWKE